MSYVLLFSVSFIMWPSLNVSWFTPNRDSYSFFKGSLSVITSGLDTVDTGGGVLLHGSVEFKSVWISISCTLSWHCLITTFHIVYAAGPLTFFALTKTEKEEHVLMGIDEGLWSAIERVILQVHRPSSCSCNDKKVSEPEKVNKWEMRWLILVVWRSLVLS